MLAGVRIGVVAEIRLEARREVRVHVEGRVDHPFRHGRADRLHLAILDEVVRENLLGVESHFADLLERQGDGPSRRHDDVERVGPRRADLGELPAHVGILRLEGLVGDDLAPRFFVLGGEGAHGDAHGLVILG